MSETIRDDADGDLALASVTAKGMMSAADKAKLDGISGAQLTVSPRGGGADDGAQLAAAYAEGAATGKLVVLRTGLYTWATAHQLPATGLQVWCEPGVTINSTLPGDGLEANAPFNYNVAPGAQATTLNGQPAKGATTVTVVDASPATLAPGLFVRLQAPVAGGLLRLATYKIISRNVGGNTITLDRPIKRTFPTASLVVPVVPIQGLRIYGNGMRITGTGDRGIEIVGGWDCYICDVEVDGTFQDFVCGYDLGSTHCMFERIRVNGNGVAYACVTFENAELCTLRTARLKGSNGHASVLLPGCVDTLIEDVKSTGGTRGIYLAVNDASNTEGCANTRIVNSHFDGSSGDGILISDGAIDTFLDNVSASYNGGAGVHVTTTLSSTAPQSVQGRGVKTEGNVSGFVCDVATKDIHLHQLVSVDNTDTDCKVAGGGVLYVDGGLIKDTGAKSAFKTLFQGTGAGSELHVADLHVQCTATTNLQLVQVDTSAKGWFHDCVAERAGAHGVVFQCTGSAFLSLTGSTRAINGVYAVLLGAATDGLYVGAQVDLATASNAIVLSNGGASTAPLNVAEAPGGYGTKALADADTTLTWTEARSGGAIKLTGTLTAGRKVRIPALKGRIRVVNGTAQTLTFIAHDGLGTEIGTGAAVVTATSAEITFDGTNVIAL